MTSDIQSKAKSAIRWSIASGILMIAAGIIALSVPFITGFVFTLWLGFMLTFVGLAQGIYSWQTRKNGGLLLKLIIGFLYIAAGILVLANPFKGILTLTVFLSIFLLFEGIFELSLAFQLRSLNSRWGWVLFDGILTLIISLMIWRHLPSSATWVIGLLIGLSIISSGISRVILSLVFDSMIEESTVSA